MLPHQDPEAGEEERASASGRSAVDLAIIGGGFAGASTAAAVARAGVGNAVLLEREPVCGSHASGRNAAIARQVEPDSVLGKLAIRGVQQLGEKQVEGRPVLNRTGGLYLIHADEEGQPPAWTARSENQNPCFQWLPAKEARRRFAFLNPLEFDYAIFSPGDGVVDIHALLTGLLAEARSAGFQVTTNCPVESLILEGSAVRGVRTPAGEIRCDTVVDATGAWAGRLGRGAHPLPLRPFRRHLFVSGESGVLQKDDPVVWDLSAGYYLRPECGGLLLCPCDESEQPPGVPATDFEAEILLAEKLARYAPRLPDVAISQKWACLRTFAPDHRPIIGWDPEIRGLFHVSGLGGFGMTTSLAVGEIASRLICGGTVDWMDVSAFSASREGSAPLPNPA